MGGSILFFHWYRGCIIVRYHIPVVKKSCDSRNSFGCFLQGCFIGPGAMYICPMPVKQTWRICCKIGRSQRTHGAIITSSWRRNGVATSFWRHNDVNIIASCTHWLTITKSKRAQPYMFNHWYILCVYITWSNSVYLLYIYIYIYNGACFLAVIAGIIMSAPSNFCQVTATDLKTGTPLYFIFACLNFKWDLEIGH